MMHADPLLCASVKSDCAYDQYAFACGKRMLKDDKTERFINLHFTVVVVKVD